MKRTKTHQNARDCPMSEAVLCHVHLSKVDTKHARHVHVLWRRERDATQIYAQIVELDLDLPLLVVDVRRRVAEK